MLRSTGQHSSCRERLSRGFCFEGRWMFTYTDEFGSPGCNCPREPLGAALIGKNNSSPCQQALPAHSAAMAGWALMSCGGAGS